MKKFLNRLQKSRRSQSNSRSESTDTRNLSTNLSDALRQRNSIGDKDTNKLHKAILNNDLKKVQLLVKRQSMVADSENRTPLHLACSNGNADIVRELLEFNAKVNALDNKLQSPLMKAIDSGNHECVNLMIAYKADLTLMDMSGNAAIHHAISSDSPEIMEILLEAGVSIDARNKFGYTPLHLAVNRQSNKLVSWLIEHGANINCLDDRNRTPLMLAAILGNVQLVQYFLENGAKIYLKDDQDRSAAQLAELYLHTECKKLIVEADHTESNEGSMGAPSTDEFDEEQTNSSNVDDIVSRNELELSDEQSVTSVASLAQENNLSEEDEEPISSEVTKSFEPVSDHVVVLDVNPLEVAEQGTIRNEERDVNSSVLAQTFNFSNHPVYDVTQQNPEPMDNEILRVSRMGFLCVDSETERQGSARSNGTKLNDKEIEDYMIDSITERTCSKLEKSDYITTANSDPKSKMISPRTVRKRSLDVTSNSATEVQLVENGSRLSGSKSSSTKSRTSPQVVNIDIDTNKEERNIELEDIVNGHEKRSQQITSSLNGVMHLETPDNPHSGESSWNSDTDSEGKQEMAKVERILSQKIREHANRSFLSRSTVKSSASQSPVRGHSGQLFEANRDSNWDTDTSTTNSPAIRRSRTQFLNMGLVETCGMRNGLDVNFQNGHLINGDTRETSDSDWDSDHFAKNQSEEKEVFENNQVLQPMERKNGVKHGAIEPDATDRDPLKETNHGFSNEQIHSKSSGRQLPRVPEHSSLAAYHTDSQSLECGKEVIAINGNHKEVAPGPVMVSIQSVATDTEDSFSVNLSPIEEADESPERQIEELDRGDITDRGFLGLRVKAEIDMITEVKEDPCQAVIEPITEHVKMTEPPKPTTERVLSTTPNFSTLYGVPTLTDHPKIIEKRSRILKHKHQENQKQTDDSHRSDGEIVPIAGDAALVLRKFEGESEMVPTDILDTTWKMEDDMIPKCDISTTSNNMSAVSGQNPTEGQRNSDRIPRNKRSSKSSKNQVYQEATIANTESVTLASCTVPERFAWKSDVGLSSNRANDAMTDQEEASLRTESLSSITFSNEVEKIQIAQSDNGLSLECPPGKQSLSIDEIDARHKKPSNQLSREQNISCSSLTDSQQPLKTNLVYALKELQKQHICCEEMQTGRDVTQLMEMMNATKAILDGNTQSTSENERLTNLEAELIRMKFKYEEECDERKELETELQRSRKSLAAQELISNELTNQKNVIEKQLLELETKLKYMEQERQLLEQNCKDLLVQSDKRTMWATKVSVVKDAVNNLHSELYCLRDTMSASSETITRDLAILCKEYVKTTEKFVSEKRQSTVNKEPCDISVQYPEVESNHSPGGSKQDLQCKEESLDNEARPEHIAEIHQLREQLLSSEARVIELLGQVECLVKMTATMSGKHRCSGTSHASSQTDSGQQVITMEEVLMRLEKAEDLVKHMSTAASSCSSLTLEKIQRMNDSAVPMQGGMDTDESQQPKDVKKPVCSLSCQWPEPEVEHFSPRDCVKAACCHRACEPNLGCRKGIPRQFSLPDEETLSLRRRIAELESDRDWMNRGTHLQTQPSEQNAANPHVQNGGGINYNSSVPGNIYQVPIHPQIMVHPQPCFYPSFNYGPYSNCGHLPQACSHCSRNPQQPSNQRCCDTGRQKRRRHHGPKAKSSYPTVKEYENVELNPVERDDQSSWSLDGEEQATAVVPAIDHHMPNSASRTNYRSSKSMCNELLLRLRPEIDKSINRHLEARDALRIGNTSPGNVMGFTLADSSPYHSKTVSMLLIDAERSLKNLGSRSGVLKKPDVQSPEYLDYLKQKYFV